MTSVTSGPQSLLPPPLPPARGEGMREWQLLELSSHLLCQHGGIQMTCYRPDSLPLMCDDGVIIFLTEESRLLTAGGNEFSTVLRADWPRTGEKLENLIKSGGS